MRKMFIIMLFTLFFVCGCVDDSNQKTEEIKGVRVNESVTTTSKISTQTSTSSTTSTTICITTSTVSSTTKTIPTTPLMTTRFPTTTVNITTKTTKQNTTKKVTKNITKKATNQGRTIYITPTGKRYHYNSHCNGGTYIESTLDEALSRGLTPCRKCVL